eukprot:CAMPEP_0184497916 /NCGR_PEP_ID=MMETSP0113_2-20130426/37727_1 /TAXON_ID=91329 /ORGANISM="Norrisiella sphaerica, Strain BC52" /LENGTH=161 /DNA_ID=CAMNT_0026885231 /DNA_START=59 /DNA_END=541 /DNA_ORIENTATION=-
MVALLNLLWLVPILTKFRNAWFTLFIDGVESFVQGIVQVLMSMAVIEMAPIGLEATTYELVISVSNSFIFLNVVIWTQFMSIYSLAEVDGSSSDVGANARMAQYTVLITSVNIFGACTCIWLFPSTKHECHAWKQRGGRRTEVAVATLVFSVLAVSYSIII